MYIAEIVVFGILAAYFSNYAIGLAHVGAAEWRWQLGTGAIPSAFFLLMLFTIPRGPRWLVKKARVQEARAVLEWIGEENVEQELQDIVQSLHLERGLRNEPLFARKYRFPIFLAVSTRMFNQLSGINAILYYLNFIFAGAGFSQLSGNLQAVAIGTTNLLFTVIAMPVIDRLGRRTLLLTGSVGTAVRLADVARIFKTGQHENLLLWLLVGYIASFAFSQGAVIWVYLAEVFPNTVRAKGQSLGSFFHWFMNALISFTFRLLLRGLFPLYSFR